MLSCYIAKGGKPAAVENIEKDCWVSLIEPNECEIARVVSATGADADMLRAALDEEETCRIEQSDEGTLIIVDFPFEEKSEGGQSSYLTLPFGIVVTENYVITVCLKESSIINELVSGKVKGLNTRGKPSLSSSCSCWLRRNTCSICARSTAFQRGLKSSCTCP
jgi:magnesium transporter